MNALALASNLPAFVRRLKRQRQVLRDILDRIEDEDDPERADRVGKSLEATEDLLRGAEAQRDQAKERADAVRTRANEAADENVDGDRDPEDMRREAQSREVKREGPEAREAPRHQEGR